MTFPAQSLSVRDPGLGAVNPTSKTPLITGISTGGSVAVNTLVSINDLSTVRALLGYGPLAEDVALQLLKNGGPVYALRHNSADSKAVSAVSMTKLVGSGPTITVTGTPRDRYAIRVEVIVGGILATSTFRFSLDAYDVDAAPFSYSQVRPTVASYVIPNSGMTLTMPAGTYVAGDVYTYACIPQEPLLVDLGAAAAVLQANSSLLVYQWLVSGAQPDDVTGAAFASAFQGYLASLANSFRYARGYCDVGSDDTAANINIGALTWTGSRVCPAYGYELRTSALPFEGFAIRKTSCVSDIAVRGFGELISSDLSRTAAGAVDGVRKIYFDGFYDQTLDANKISTMRTWTGMAGFYIANGKLKSAFGSDFTDMQYGRVMDVACRTTFEAQFPFISASLRTTIAANASAENPVGAIDPRDAKRIEGKVQTALDANIMQPDNAEGIPGHATSVTYSVDLLQDLVTTQLIKTYVDVVPLGYSKSINTTLFFSTGA